MSPGLRVRTPGCEPPFHSISAWHRVGHSDALWVFIPLTHWQYHQHYWLLVTDCTFFSLCLFKEAIKWKTFEILLISSELQNSQQKFSKGVQAACKPESPLGSEVKRLIVWNGPHSHLGTITETYKLQNWDGWLLYPWKQMLAWPKRLIMIMINHPWNHCYLLVYNDGTMLEGLYRIALL